MKIKWGWDETRDLLSRTSQLCGLSDRCSFSLMVFYSGCIFLTIAASFSRSHHLTGLFVCSWTFAKGPCWSWAFLSGTFSRLLQWLPGGLSHYRSVLGCLFMSLILPLPRDTCTRGFLLAGLPSSPGVPFLLALAGRFFDFATKTQTIQKSFQHGEHETDREQRKQHPKC